MTIFVMTFFGMNKFANIIREKRLSLSTSVKAIAQKIDVDASLLSRFESGTRFPTREQVHLLAEALKLDRKELEAVWLSEKISMSIAESNDEVRLMALQLVQESMAEYLVKPKMAPSVKKVIKEIDQLKKSLNKYRKLDSYRIAQALELEYTFDSNRIEGNTLTLRETDLVINEGMTIAGKSMREHLEAINHQDAILYVKDLITDKVHLTESHILRIHNLVLRGIDAQNAGRYRNVQVMIKGSKHIPPQPFMVAKEMENLMDWYETNHHRLHPVVLAAEMHQRLVTIHPFIDGNGRTSRLVMNLILLQKGFVIANIKGDVASRVNYYNTLENSQTGSSNDDFILFVADVEKQCLEYYLKVIASDNEP